MAFVYAWIVPLWPINSYHSFWWSNFFKTKVCWFELSLALSFSLTLTVRGVSNKHCLLTLWADKLLPQLLMEQFDTLPIQCRHIEHMHEGVWFTKINFWQNDSCENLDNFSLMGLLYMHRWCLHGPINSYHSFWLSNLILCLYNVDTLNICMKEFGSEKIIFDKMTAVRT